MDNIGNHQSRGSERKSCKNSKEEEIVNLSFLQSLLFCGTEIEYYIMRAEYIALISRNSTVMWEFLDQPGNLDQ